MCLKFVRSGNKAVWLGQPFPDLSKGEKGEGAAVLVVFSFFLSDNGPQRP